ncbi:MAG: peptidoglycan-binding protein, partial [Oscillospiraceae bacterium]
QGEPEKLFDVQPNLQEGTSNYVLQTVVIPTYVTVHLGKPSASAQNVQVPFLTYLKSVAASEIYPTWPYEALKANILCQVTFVLNRIYTEWYKSKGYNFDITNSTSYDQKYIHNRSTFATTDRVVEEVFNNYVTKTYNKEPYFTEYCDGKTVKCNGLSQWGAYNKAVAGANSLQILKDYYGADIQVNESNNIASIPMSYPGTPLKKGSSGQNVQVIQAQLNRIGDNYPSIKKLNVDGIFGDAMENSVKAFQKIFNLSQDGIVGKTTWYKISYIYVAVKKLAELTSEGEAIKNGSYPGYVVKRGDRGVNVMIVQYYINQTAVYVDSIDSVKLDGVFGAGLETQVKNFQRFFNLAPDGKVGALTWNKMFEIFLSIKNGVTIPPQTPPQNDSYPGSPLRIGSYGANVTKIQQWLNGVAQVYPAVPQV